MPLQKGLAATALLVGLAAPTPGRAWGVPGCVNLPSYERALGALQGMTGPCDMSVEEANRIVAAHGNVPGGMFGALLSSPPGPAAEAVPAPHVARSRPRQVRPRQVHPHAAHRREAVVR